MPSRISVLLFPVLLALAAGLFFFARSGGVVPARPALSPAVLPGSPSAADDLTEAAFREQFASAINALRKRQGWSPLAEDPQLGQDLDGNATGTQDGPSPLTLTAEAFPGFRSVRAALASGGTLTELHASLLRQLDTPESARDDRFGLRIRTLSGQHYEVIAMTGEALPEMTLAILNDGRLESFGVRCVHCRKRSAFRQENSPGTLMINCPACGRCTGLFGRDTKGRYFDAPAFLVKSQAPSVPPGTHPLDAMISIWKVAVARCDYVEDDDGGQAADFWQLPRQTLQKRTGDCEDSALLLADWMLSNHIPARVAVGTMNGGGHAWCIVRVEGTDYLLESTNRYPDLENLPAVNPDDGYVPTALFDRGALYVRARPDLPFDSDYWSPEKWVPLPRTPAKPRQERPATAVTP